MIGEHMSLFVTRIIAMWAMAFMGIVVANAQFSTYRWTTPGTNPSESMPVGGGDMGLNVWLENGQPTFYLCRSGSFDENNTLLKAGKFKVLLSSPLKTSSENFNQTLHLDEGFLSLEDGEKRVEIWVDVYKPVVHVDVISEKPLVVKTQYESWRKHNRNMTTVEAQQCSYKWTLPKDVFTRKDSIRETNDAYYFYHHNGSHTVFDITVAQQGLNDVAAKMYNPLAANIFGGKWQKPRTKAGKVHHLHLVMAQTQGNLQAWNRALTNTEQTIAFSSDRKRSRSWWKNFWKRSYVEAPDAWQNATRNYALFRYMLGCNVHSEWPTKFNGGLFTFDPVYVDSTMNFSPDFRRWGGGTHTAQNQRLVYWPMLANGDFDLMLPQFDFYLRILDNARLRTSTYWQHGGACFPEQIENFGLCNPAEYGSKRPKGFDAGVEYNAWLEYEWDTVLEFCEMILQTANYSGANIERYKPFIADALRFFDEHYRMLASKRGRKELNDQGYLTIFPGSACETYKMAYNPASTLAALKTVLNSYITLMDSAQIWKDMLKRIPPIPLRTVHGKTMIAPAVTWERVQNVETPQLYPVFPWRMYGVGMDNLEIARNTYLFDADAMKFRSAKGWKQDNIWAACLGLTADAKQLTLEKLANGPFKFPAFWGPDYDWAPDHNHGGSGMLGLQLMLLQEVQGKILLFPAWHATDDISFKLHCSHNTTVEATLKGGKLIRLNVTPASRLKDIQVINKDITYKNKYIDD